MQGPGSDEEGLAAGDFSSWMADMKLVVRGEGGADVPCNGCTSCCTSSQFVHIEPDETETLRRIAPELLFAAPRRPAGHVLLGYDERGHCPMLVDERCSIYEHRPRACRAYDCRVLAAAGVELDGGDGAKVAIARRVRRWRFSFPTKAAVTRRDAVRAAAKYLDDHASVLPEGTVPRGGTQLAVLAIAIHDLFVTSNGENDQPTVLEPEPEIVHAALRAIGSQRTSTQ
ncbi:MAG: YkgJ family cysteine cluster protein [Acidimicrobiales bacterium]